MAEHGMPRRREQIWAKQVGPVRFLVRSLPFFRYGIRPGDEVETDENYTVQRVVTRSGRELLRVAATPQVTDEVLVALHRLLEELELIHEWHRNGYVAIELADRAIPEALESFLHSRMSQHQLRFEFA